MEPQAAQNRPSARRGIHQRRNGENALWLRSLPINATDMRNNTLIEMRALKMQTCGHRPATIAHFPGQSTRTASDHFFCRSLPHRAIRTMTSASSDLWALDFDGVTCDSCGESSLSAWKVRIDKSSLTALFFFVSTLCCHSSLQAAAALWPERFSATDALARKDQLVEDMRAVRPVVETG